MVRNVTSRHAGTVRDTLKSSTFYHVTGREKGEEVADYAQNFDSTGAIIKTETVYIYEGDKGADTATA